MGVIALDTSTEQLTIAIGSHDRAQSFANFELKSRLQHGETLVQVVSDLLDLTQLTPDKIDTLLVGQGPGSYTGLRIGATFAKVWAKSLSIPLQRISSLALMIPSTILQEKTLYIPMMDARRGNVYAGGYVYQNGKLQLSLSDQHISIESLHQWVQTSTYERIVWIGTTESLIETAALKNDSFVVSYPVAKRAFLPAFESLLITVEDIDTFVPNYGQTTQAEREWKAGKLKSGRDDGTERDLIDYHVE